MDDLRTASRPSLIQRSRCMNERTEGDQTAGLTPDGEWWPSTLGLRISTPFLTRWKRELYERIFFPVCGLLLEDLRPRHPDGRYDAGEVLERIPEAAGRLAERTSPEDQEMFLEAVGEPFADPIGPIEPDCRCRYCREARRALRRAAQVPREDRVRDLFVHVIVWHIHSLFKKPDAYHRRRGLPRLSVRRRDSALTGR